MSNTRYTVSSDIKLIGYSSNEELAPTEYKLIDYYSSLEKINKKLEDLFSGESVSDYIDDEFVRDSITSDSIVAVVNGVSGLPELVVDITTTDSPRVKRALQRDLPKLYRYLLS